MLSAYTVVRGSCGAGLFGMADGGSVSYSTSRPDGERTVSDSRGRVVNMRYVRPDERAREHHTYTTRTCPLKVDSVKSV